DAVILSAPMVAPAGGGMPEWGAHLVAKLFCAIGRGKRRARTGSAQPLEPEVLRRGLFTHAAARSAGDFVWFRERPFVRLGPGSWRWVERAYASARRLRDKQRLEAVDTPVFGLATAIDELVDNATIERAVQLRPHAEMKLFGPECAHEIYREVDDVRNGALQASFEFLDRVAPSLNNLCALIEQ